MEVGLLWFDNDKKRTLEEKVLRAARHYTEKFGQVPTVCFLHPNALNGGPDNVGGVYLRPAKNVLLHHFWIGLDERFEKGSTNGNGKGRAIGTT